MSAEFDMAVMMGNHGAYSPRPIGTSMSIIKENKRRHTRIAGLSHASKKLTEMGWHVMPPSNGVSTVLKVSNKNGTASFEVQSRASTEGLAAKVGSTLDKSLPEWWVITTHPQDDKKRTSYILSREDVTRLGKKDEDGQVWIEIRDYARAEFKEAWKRIPLPR